MRRTQTGRGYELSRALTSLVTVTLLGAACMLAGSCAQDVPQDRTPPECVGPDGGTPVDPALLAFLSRARAAHHRADAFEKQGKLEPAIAELAKVIRGPVPHAQQPYPEVQEVLADTRARVADLESRLGKFDEAMQQVKAGLRLAEQRSYFRGHLFEVRGLVEERRAKALKEQGDAEAAEAARQRALAAFEHAMQIQAEVIRQAVPKE